MDFAQNAAFQTIERWFSPQIFAGAVVAAPADLAGVLFTASYCARSFSNWAFAASTSLANVVTPFSASAFGLRAFRLQLRDPGFEFGDLFLRFGDA